jgi:hypothetical protein
MTMITMSTTVPIPIYISLSLFLFLVALSRGRKVSYPRVRWQTLGPTDEQGTVASGKGPFRVRYAG